MALVTGPNDEPRAERGPVGRGPRRALDLTEQAVAVIVERTEGVTASFLKELVRRSVLESLHEHDPLATVTAEHTMRALDDLLDSTQQVTRSLLGVGNDPETLPPGGGSAPPGASAGWSAYGSRLTARRAWRS